MDLLNLLNAVQNLKEEEWKFNVLCGYPTEYIKVSPPESVIERFGLVEGIEWIAGTDLYEAVQFVYGFQKLQELYQISGLDRNEK